MEISTQLAGAVRASRSEGGSGLARACWRRFRPGMAGSQVPAGRAAEQIRPLPCDLIAPLVAR
jgi:hypothetical protein